MDGASRPSPGPHRDDSGRSPGEGSAGRGLHTPLPGSSAGSGTDPQWRMGPGAARGAARDVAQAASESTEWFIKYVRDLAGKEGLDPESLERDWFQRLRDTKFRQKKTRDLCRLWAKRGKIEGKIKKLKCGKGRKSTTRSWGQRMSLKTRHAGAATVRRTVKTSRLKPIFDKVQIFFERLRAAGIRVRKR